MSNNLKKNKQESLNEINQYFVMYYMQLMRVKYVSTYAEKSILSQYIKCIQAFYNAEIDALEKHLNDYLEECKNSYYGWSTKYYQSEYDKRIKYVEELRHRVNTTRTSKFLDLNLSIDDKEIDKEFSKFITKSTNQVFLLKNDPNSLHNPKKIKKESKKQK